MRTRLSLRSSRGSSLISVIMGLGLLGIATYGVLSYNSKKTQSSQQLNIQAVADQIKQKVVGYIISPDSWQQTQLHNTQAFDRFTNSTPGGEISSNSLDIYPAGLTSEAFYRSSQPKAGFDIHGNPCVGENFFNATTGSDTCPFRYELSLIGHTFQNGNWMDKIHFQLKFAPATLKAVLNANSPQYTFDLIRNLNDKSAESSCISLNGQYNTGSGTCSVKLTKATSCASSAKAYRGPASNSNGNSCDSPTLNSTACGAGKAITGFDSQGNPQCSPI